MKHLILRSLLAVVLAAPYAHGGEGRFDATLKQSRPSEKLTCWVFFRDKGTTPLSKLAQPSSLVSERSLKRRLNVLPADQLVDETDLPLEKSYVDQVAALVTKVRQQTKWLNGVSVEATPEQLARVSNLPFVKEIQPVARFWNKRSVEVPSPPESSPSGRTKGAEPDSLNYGPSQTQLQLINVPAVHNTGNSAQGILIGVFDNGVRLLSHHTFDNLRPRIVAMHDFVDNKVDVQPDNPSAGFGAHGVITLSTIGGYSPGQLIGPAYGASFILARTENDSASDFYPSEEDNWIAAAEWAESLGVQVTSTSLGYFEHVKTDSPWVVDPATSWKWSDMNGKTIPISRAATLAARKGVVVVNSAGNDASRGDPNTLIAPADADSIVSVGAVTANDQIASFSSYGPTVDGRIKPDVVAQGVFVRCADPIVDSLFTYASGTSLSCPLVAGAAALILKAHPTAKPMDVVNALKATANNAAVPNNHYGWGLIDVLAAINYLTPPSSVASYSPLRTIIRGNSIQFFLPEPGTVTIRVYNILGQEIKTLLNNVPISTTSSVNWDATASDGHRVASGVYFFRLEAKGVSGSSYFDAGKTMVLR
jgi:subtilisin family serine protease